jgi:hypothetical protein
MLSIKPTLTRLIRYWSIPALLATVVFGTIYAASHQVIRLEANNRQIELATEIANRQESGQNIQNLLPQDKIDPSISLSTFVILFNESGQPVNSSATLDRSIPEIPQGVLQNAKTKGLHSVTWEPREGVRIAASVAYFEGKSNGYVLVGRSLKESERQETRIFYVAIAGWLLSLLLIFLVAILIPDKNLGLKTTSTPKSETKEMAPAMKEDDKPKKSQKTKK